MNKNKRPLARKKMQINGIIGLKQNLLKKIGRNPKLQKINKKI